MRVDCSWAFVRIVLFFPLLTFYDTSFRYSFLTLVIHFIPRLHHRRHLVILSSRRLFLSRPFLTMHCTYTRRLYSSFSYVYYTLTESILVHVRPFYVANYVQRNALSLQVKQSPP